MISLGLNRIIINSKINSEYKANNIALNKPSSVDTVTFVAGSPIFDTGRIFNDTLLDENAACHIAIGSGFSECTEGANDIKNYKERQEYLKNNNVNICDIHNDFMIGGPNVVVEGITKDGKAITIIKDNKFQI